MVIIGIICEYNPFHRGHKYQIEEAKKITKADYVVAVMSGNFVQRGEPAVFSKQSRVCAALANGIDMVLELPFPYACASAQYFAEGAVSVLNSLKCVSYMSFGSECGDIVKLKKAADNFEAEKAMIKVLLSKGVSYAKAVETLTGIKKGESNNMLGVEYIKAIKKFESSIIPMPVKRISGEDYLTAAQIREKLYSDAHSGKEKNMCGFLNDVLPKESAEIFVNEIKSGRGPVFFDNMEQIIFSKIRTLGTDFIKILPGVSEGLENKIYEGASVTCSLSELVAFATSKRYTSSRIRRILINAAISPANADNMYDYTKPVPYVRILGMKKDAAPLASCIRENAVVPIACSNAEAKKICPELAEAEALGTDIYSVICPSGILPGRQEYRSKFIII